MTWRERNAEVAAGARYGKEDIIRWASCEKCLVGETVIAIFGRLDMQIWVKVNRLGPDPESGFQAGITKAIQQQDHRWLDRRLDEIEDAALRVKREAL